MASPSRTRRDVLVAVLAVQFMALLIGLAMPITPSKTGSDGSLAELFFRNPGYLQEVAVYFVLTNLLIGAMILAAWVWERLRRTRGGSGESPNPPEAGAPDAER